MNITNWVKIPGPHDINCVGSLQIWWTKPDYKSFHSLDSLYKQIFWYNVPGLKKKSNNSLQPSCLLPWWVSISDLWIKLQFDTRSRGLNIKSRYTYPLSIETKQIPTLCVITINQCHSTHPFISSSNSIPLYFFGTVSPMLTCMLKAAIKIWIEWN